MHFVANPYLILRASEQWNAFAARLAGALRADSARRATPSSTSRRRAIAAARRGSTQGGGATGFVAISTKCHEGKTTGGPGRGESSEEDKQ